MPDGGLGQRIVSHRVEACENCGTAIFARSHLPSGDIEWAHVDEFDSHDKTLCSTDYPHSRATPGALTERTPAWSS